MGIPIPPVPPPPPPIPIVCPWLGSGDMGPMYLSLNGVIGTDPFDFFNKTYKLMPDSPCRWSSYFSRPGGTDQFIGIVQKNGDETLIYFGHSDLTFAYCYYSNWIPVNSGPNQRPSPLGCVSWITSLINPGLIDSMTDLATSMGLDVTKKTFLEPDGINLAEGTHTERLAQQYNGSCCRIKLKSS